MPAEAAPVRRLARRSLRVHALLIAVVVLATLQAGLLLSVGARLFNDERSKIEFHFRRLDGTLREQERFLQQWRLHDVGTQGQPVADGSVGQQRGPLFANVEFRLSVIPEGPKRMLPDWLPNALYLAGSLCFVAGTVINMLRSGH